MKLHNIKLMEPADRLKNKCSENSGYNSTGQAQHCESALSLLKLFLLIPLFLFLYIFSSCTPVSCIEETNAFVKVSFYNSETRKLTPPDSITIFGLGMETNKLYDKGFRVQPALLPLNAAADKCVYIIIINGITDTLALTYNSYPHLISKECGYSFYHTIDTTLTITHYDIDSVKIMKRNITTINEENIRIYY